MYPPTTYPFHPTCSSETPSVPKQKSSLPCFLVGQPQHKKPPGLGRVLRFGPMSGLEAFLRLAQLDSALDQARRRWLRSGEVGGLVWRFGLAVWGCGMVGLVWELRDFSHSLNCFLSGKTILVAKKSDYNAGGPFFLCLVRSSQPRPSVEQLISCFFWRGTPSFSRSSSQQKWGPLSVPVLNIWARVSRTKRRRRFPSLDVPLHVPPKRPPRRHTHTRMPRERGGCKRTAKDRRLGYFQDLTFSMPILFTFPSKAWFPLISD